MSVLTRRVSISSACRERLFEQGGQFRLLADDAREQIAQARPFGFGLVGGENLNEVGQEAVQGGDFFAEEVRRLEPSILRVVHPPDNGEEFGQVAGGGGGVGR